MARGLALSTRLMQRPQLIYKLALLLAATISARLIVSS